MITTTPFCPQPGAEVPTTAIQVESHREVSMSEDSPIVANDEGIIFDRKSRRTLYLTGGIRREKTAKRCRSAFYDSRFRSIHIVGNSFTMEENKPGDLNGCIRQLLSFDSRPWRSIKVSGCRGDGVPYLIESICSSNVKKLTLSLARGDELKSIEMLSRCLTSNRNIMMLGIHNTDLSGDVCDCLARGLRSNTSLLELSLQKSRFTEPDSSLSFANAIRFCNNIQSFSFQDCGMSDIQVYDIVSALSLSESVKDLNLSGNDSCGIKASTGLSRLLQSDISQLSSLSLCGILLNSTYENALIEVLQSVSFSSLVCLQLSDNSLSDEIMAALSSAIRRNTNLRVLQLSWTLSSDFGVDLLADSLTENETLQKLILHDAQISNKGLENLASRLPAVLGLKTLEIGGRQGFSESGVISVIENLKLNSNIEEISIQTTDEYSKEIELVTDLNRAGRRWLSHYDKSPCSLLPLILERACKVPMPSISGDSWWFEDQRSSFDSDVSDIIASDSVLGEDRNEYERRATALYHLIRNTL